MQRLLVHAEGAWDAVRRRRRGPGPPRNFRIEAYLGHGGSEGIIVRGRVLDDPPPSLAVEGEGVIAAARRSLRQFVTTELSGVPLRVTVDDEVELFESDEEGYFTARLDPAAPSGRPWIQGSVELAGDYRGLTDPHRTPVAILVPDATARFGVISDVDDTIIETGVQRVGDMLLQTLTGSALTRTPFAGAAELYRDLAAEVNPVFYVSSSPWNLHAFLLAFLRHRDFPIGPLLLRDLIGDNDGRARKHGRIEEVLRLHPELPFVLIGDSGEKDPAIYADIVRAHPGRILAVYIREVRLDPGDGRVERVTADWTEDVPFVLAADSDAVRRHAASMGLLTTPAAES
jgi:phosphatidate phosphatase APP1